MSRSIAVILKIPILSSSAKQLLREVIDLGAVSGPGKKKAPSPVVIFTPNAEFLVEARRNPSFKTTLAKADINIADGIGLVWAGRVLGQPVVERVSGADLVEGLLAESNRQGWKVGIVGVRRGEMMEARTLFKRLEKKYPQTKFVNFDDSRLTIDDSRYNLVLACQGMIKQEEWILAHKDKIKANVFIGAGGSLDFLAGFTKRAPSWLRSLGLEWLWRGLTKPGHWKRVWRAVFVFPILVLRERFSNNQETRPPIVKK